MVHSCPALRAIRAPVSSRPSSNAPVRYPIAMSSSSSVIPSATSRSSSRVHQRHHLVGVLRAACRRPMLNHAGVGVRADAGVHRVDQPAPLADLLEQPARQAATEHVVDDVERLARGVVARQARGRRSRCAPARCRRRRLGRRRAPVGACADGSAAAGGDAGERRARSAASISSCVAAGRRSTTTIDSAR